MIEALSSFQISNTFMSFLRFNQGFATPREHVHFWSCLTMLFIFYSYLILISLYLGSLLMFSTFLIINQNSSVRYVKFDYGLDMLM